jgi:hypothetical protein
VAGAAGVLLTPAIVNFVLLPAIGAAHGWLTNTLAVWLLFRPVEPWRVPLFGWRVQGVLPRRQADLARSVGVAVETELLSWGELASALAAPDVLEDIARRVDALVYDRVARAVPAWVPGAWRDGLARGAANAIAREAADGLVGLLPQAAELARERLPIAKMVEDRILRFAPDDRPDPHLGRRLLRADGHRLEGVDVDHVDERLGGGQRPGADVGNPHGEADLLRVWLDRGGLLPPLSGPRSLAVVPKPGGTEPDARHDNSF